MRHKFLPWDAGQFDAGLYWDVEHRKEEDLIRRMVDLVLHEKGSVVPKAHNHEDVDQAFELSGDNWLSETDCLES